MKEVKIKRDERGFWTHPNLPKWDEGTTLDEARAWFANYGLTCDLVLMEGEIADKWGAGEINSCADWEPEMPADAFLVDIYDTEDGVVAMYAEPACEVK